MQEKEKNEIKKIDGKYGVYKKNKKDIRVGNIYARHGVLITFLQETCSIYL